MVDYSVLLMREPDGRYSVTVPALPGCVTWGHDVDEATALAEEAMVGYLSSLRDRGLDLPGNVTEIWINSTRSEEFRIRRRRVPDEATLDNHVVLSHPRTEALLVIPVHSDDEDLPEGTVEALIAASGLTIEEFTELLQ